ncbi:hypothetical protein EZV62_015072 [Acer yangbiense]|uniref:SWIM-type domain-containing protein n=1 Tax=Acer yangbiense TaxID=1000413 RepID=A0A5C7HUM8_9ROSI|nr:hypothetical protein EZV62_015072 [Acer yangbiense]
MPFASDMDIFTINVMFGTEVVKVGQCDCDHISLITLIHATIHELSGKDEVPNEDCLVWIHLPWCGERVQVNSDSELIEFFKVFGDRELGKIAFELENTCYVPSPPEGSILDPMKSLKCWISRVVTKLWANKGQNMQYDKVTVFEEESIDGDDDIIKECMDLFEGYQSKSDDEYFSDSELEPEQVRIAKLMKGIPFKKMMCGEIKFEVGQTFDNAEQMREVFREYAIQDGVKWIASKFENLVRRNPSICVKVISDLLREKYKVSVDIQRLYKAKKRALEGLVKDHATSFGKLRRYAYMINQTKKLGFLEGCKPFIGVDGCHLKGPYRGVLLLAVALDANSRYSARHIYANFRLTYKVDYLKKLFWRASRSSNVFDFKETMDEIGGTHRASSYLDLLEFIRRMVMRKFQDRKEECPNEGYVVKLSEYSCQCSTWQVSEIPCRHAIAAISHHCGKAAIKDKVSAYVHQSLTKSAYMQTYNGMIHPIPDQKRWPKVPACILVEDILTTTLIPHEHLRFLNLINPPLMAIVELDDVSMIVLDALDLCCLSLIDIVVVG